MDRKEIEVEDIRELIRLIEEIPEGTMLEIPFLEEESEDERQ